MVDEIKKPTFASEVVGGGDAESTSTDLGSTASEPAEWGSDHDVDEIRRTAQGTVMGMDLEGVVPPPTPADASVVGEIEQSGDTAKFSSDAVVADNAPEGNEQSEAEQSEASSAPTDQAQGTLGTFTGVFRPTILTILGMMAYLRLGWVVGEAGLFGAFAIFFLIYCITFPTALSLSSIATNIRLGAGGVFSIISRSLGIETGGAIGIPLYLAQALSGALYIYGFSEAWGFIFPDHPKWIPTIGCFLLVSLTSAISTKLAFKLQGIVMVMVVTSMAIVFLGVLHIGDHVPQLHNPQLFGNFKNNSFWDLFAVIFPAGTGVMVGVTMSGALKHPRKSVPIGTIAAVLTSFVVYLSFIVWYSIVATPEELSTNFLISVDRSAWKPGVLAGIVASTFTAALSSFNASPRILYALAVHKILPGSKFLSKTTKDGTPRNATFFTICLIGVALSLGSLERLAVLITVFFLLTYFTINMVLLIEQSLGMISFRPMLKIPMAVAAVGSLLSIFAMIVISPSFALVALTIIVAVYIWLANRHLVSPWETVRSSIFVALADWAARRVARSSDEHNERSWKPDILVPVQSRSQIDGSYRFLRALAYPKGSVQMVGFAPPEPIEERPMLPGGGTWNIVEEDPHLKKVVREFHQDDLYATGVTISANELVHGIEQACAVLGSNYSPPTVVFSNVNNFCDEELRRLYLVSISREIGLAVLSKHPQSGLGRERIINVWIRSQAPDWNLGLKMANTDLALLLAYQLSKNWEGEINLITSVEKESDLPPAEAFLTQLVEDARLPTSTQVVVKWGDFKEQLASVPQADLQIIGFSQHTGIKTIDDMMRLTNSSVLAVRSSGRESALA